MGWASRANQVSQDAKAGRLKPKEARTSGAVRRDQTRLKVPLIVLIMAALGRTK